jgi:hypothetical protein
LSCSWNQIHIITRSSNNKIVDYVWCSWEIDGRCWFFVFVFFENYKSWKTFFFSFLQVKVISLTTVAPLK